MLKMFFMGLDTKMSNATQSKKVSSIIQVVLIKGIEIGLAMQDRKQKISLTWLHDPSQVEIREEVIDDAMKQIKKFLKD